MSATSNAFIPILLGAVADQEAGRLVEAATGFTQVLALEPDQPQALLFAGVLALRMGQPERSAALLERAVAVRPTLPEAHFAHGNALWADGRRSEARVAWQNAIRFDTQHVGALLNLAQAQEQSGEAELAVGNCRAAIAARPDHPQPWTILSSALRSIGEAQKALTAADTAIQLSPAFAPAHHQRGMTLKLLGRTTDAAAALREAVARNPGLAPSHLNLANLLARSRRPRGRRVSLPDGDRHRSVDGGSPYGPGLPAHANLRSPGRHRRVRRSASDQPCPLGSTLQSGHCPVNRPAIFPTVSRDTSGANGTRFTARSSSRCLIPNG